MFCDVCVCGGGGGAQLLWMLAGEARDQQSDKSSRSQVSPDSQKSSCCGGSFFVFRPGGLMNGKVRFLSEPRSPDAFCLLTSVRVFCLLSGALGGNRLVFLLFVFHEERKRRLKKQNSRSQGVSVHNVILCLCHESCIVENLIELDHHITIIASVQSGLFVSARTLYVTFPQGRY